ncbi:MAG: recombinase zinc beta ribbon domain-containing protein, partial [Eubacteriaceae bacterium]|nr:recombinase zinc beta ribbon domain-containing protein [Eubacteriaceae bacterium]
GLVVCHSCGSSLVYQSANNGFQCHSYAKGSCSVSHFISAKKLEEAVLSGISLINIDETFIRENTKANVPKDDKLELQLEKLNHMLERCKAAYAEGVDSLEEYKNNKERITREIDGINSRIEERKKEVKYASVDEVRSEFNGLLDLLRSDADVNVKHDAFEGIVEKAVFSKGTADETGLELFLRL